MAKLQNALVRVGENLAVGEGETGVWEPRTSAAVVSFQSKNGIPPGGREAGRKTFLALDAHLRSGKDDPPKPTPPQPKPPQPQAGPQLAVSCDSAAKPGGGATAGVSGTGFAANTGIAVKVDGTNVGFAGTDASGTFVFPLSISGLADGPHEISVISGANETATGSLTLPCQPKPTPAPGPLNPELEAVLDRIDFAYQKLITRQRDGVQAFCRDMSVPDFEQVQLTTFEKTFMRILWTALYAVPEGSILIMVTKFMRETDLSNESGSERVKEIIDKVFDDTSSVMQDLAEKKVQSESTGTREDAVAKFCDDQLDDVTTAGFAVADKFEKSGKPPMRAVVPPDPTHKRNPENQSGDPRVDLALSHLAAISEVTKNAFPTQYDTMLLNWDKVMVVTKSKGGEVAKDKIEGPTKLEEFVARAPIPAGVFQVRLKSLLAQNHPVTIDKIMVDGLSPRLRRDLAKRASTVDQLVHLPPKFAGQKTGSFPVIAEGDMPNPVNPRSNQTTLVRVGINEAGNTFDLSGPRGEANSSAEWLRIHGGGDRATGVLILLREVGVSSVGEINRLEKSPISGV